MKHHKSRACVKRSDHAHGHALSRSCIQEAQVVRELLESDMEFSPMTVHIWLDGLLIDSVATLV